MYITFRSVLAEIQPIGLKILSILAPKAGILDAHNNTLLKYSLPLADLGGVRAAAFQLSNCWRSFHDAGTQHKSEAAHIAKFVL